jgi:sulfhydrogenase subunit alpha
MARVIELENITKVEGHAKLFLNIDGENNIKRCELESIEGSRYFEGMLKGRLYYEAPEISSRICGICSCAHVIAAITAIEDAIGMKVTPQTKILREIFTIGERIRSHITHMYFLSLPDYVGVESGIDLAKTHREEVLRALRLIKLGNDIIFTVAGRDLHPVSAQVGGFLKLPSQEELDALLQRLKDALPDAVAAAKLFSKLKYPSFREKETYFSIMEKGVYPMLTGSLYCSDGDVYDRKDFDKFFKEYHESRSTANFVIREGSSYMVGSLARMNNNHALLSKSAKKLVVESKIKLPSDNPFHIPFAQAIETVHYIETVIGILSNFKVVDEKPLEMKPKAGRGVGVTEAPRGFLIHEYWIDDKGVITKANIVTPTAQNLKCIEESIKHLLPSLLKLDNKELVVEVEKLIRSFDPCFSCSTHFLEVEFEGARKDA